MLKVFVHDSADEEALGKHQLVATFQIGMPSLASLDEGLLPRHHNPDRPSKEMSAMAYLLPIR